MFFVSQFFDKKGKKGVAISDDAFQMHVFAVSFLATAFADKVGSAEDSQQGNAAAEGGGLVGVLTMTRQRREACANTI